MDDLAQRVSTMSLNRRGFLTGTASSAVTAGAAGATTNVRALGLDATDFGVRPDTSDDQTSALQKAIDRAAASRVPLALGPGKYRAAGIVLPAGIILRGVRGATRLTLTNGTSLLAGRGADGSELSSLVLDGGKLPLPERRALVHFADGSGLRVRDCDIVDAGGNALALERISGEVRGNTVTHAAAAAIFSLDARGLLIADNTVRGAGNNGIQVWRSAAGDDGTLVVDNRIEDIHARAGGSGQNGNAVNVFRAGGVIVRGNRIARAAFSAVRGNSASNLQVSGNTCIELGEVALYAEFGFEGAVIAGNVVDGAAVGVSVTNFSSGGRLAVVQGNLIRNLVPKRPPGTDPEDGAGIGIAVEADTAVSGNVIERAPEAGIWIGWGRHQRDVSITGNIVREAGYGIAVSVAPGAGAALIADNLIAGARRAAIVGMEWKKAVTGDLTKDGAERYALLALRGNKVR
jgi:uncharacterized secreted repeat protein (TIGR03808 family)